MCCRSSFTITDQNIGLLNSFYSIAPIATVLIGGILIDRLGVRRALLAFRLYLSCRLHAHRLQSAL